MQGGIWSKFSALANFVGADGALRRVLAGAKKSASLFLTTECAITDIPEKKDDPDMAQLIAVIKIPRTRAVLPEKKLTVEKVNGQEAARSGYASCFKEHGFVNDRGKLVFW